MAANKWYISLASAKVSDAAGAALDGDWTTSVSTFAAGSGNGAPGGDFNFRFNVLPGDSNADGSISSSDLQQLKQRLGTVTNATDYRDDTNASGVIRNGQIVQAVAAARREHREFLRPDFAGGQPDARAGTCGCDDRGRRSSDFESGVDSGCERGCHHPDYDSGNRVERISHRFAACFREHSDDASLNVEFAAACRDQHGAGNCECAIATSPFIRGRIVAAGWSKRVRCRLANGQIWQDRRFSDPFCSDRLWRCLACGDFMTQELWTAVDQYIADLLVPADRVLDEALAASAAAGLPPIAVSPNQGKLLQIMAPVQGARNILEIGTLGGYSTIWLARALPAGGRLITLELEPLLRRRGPHEHCASRTTQSRRLASWAGIADAAADCGRRRRTIRSDLHRRRQAEQSGLLRLGAAAVTAWQSDYRGQCHSQRCGDRRR